MEIIKSIGELGQLVTAGFSLLYIIGIWSGRLKWLKKKKKNSVNIQKVVYRDGEMKIVKNY